MRSPITRLIYWVMVAGLFAASWWWVLPPQLGGRTTLFTTHGISMEPLLHQGDLAVLHKSRHYKVGDVIAFHAQTLGVVSLHRIVSVEGDVITMKGDNNNHADIDHPTQKQIIGRMDNVYSGKGKYLSLLHSPLFRVGITVFVAFVVYFGIRLPARENIENSTTSASKTKSLRSPIERVSSLKTIVHRIRMQELSRSARHVAAAVFGIGLVLSVLLTFLAFAHPVRTSKSGETIYNLNGRFGYSATVKPEGDVVYTDGQVSTGDPVYLNLVDDLFVTFNFNVDSPATFKGKGTITTSLVVSGKSGWTHAAPLGDQVDFNGDNARVNGDINLADAFALSRQIQGLTKVADAGLTITIRPTVRLDGTLAGQPFNETFVSQLSLTGDPKVLKIAEGSTTPPIATQSAAATNPKQQQPVTTGLNTNKSGTLTIPPGAPSRLAAFGMSVGIATLRIAGILGTLCSLGALLLLEWRRRDAKDADVETNNSSDYSNLIVPVSGFASVAEENSVVDVGSLAHLARIAEAGKMLILQETHSAGETFVVNVQSTTYRYNRLAPTATDRFGAASDWPSTQAAESYDE